MLPYKPDQTSRRHVGIKNLHRVHVPLRIKHSPNRHTSIIHPVNRYRKSLDLEARCVCVSNMLYIGHGDRRQLGPLFALLHMSPWRPQICHRV